MPDIIFIGDIAFTGILSYHDERNEDRYDQIVPLLKQTDLVFANLEVPLKVDNSKNEYKNFIHYSLPEPTEQLLKLLNIGCVSLANNHIYDCKMSGLKATIGMLDKLGVYHTGAGWKPEHIEPVVIEYGDIKIAFMAYVDKKTNPKTENFDELYINYFSKDNVVTDIDKVKNSVDKIIVSIHWGEDYSHYQTTEQVEISHDLIDAGVDVIMGHHPHTLQPFEKYNGGLIFYSLGGLTFGDYMKPGKKNLQALFRKTKKGLIAKYNVLTGKVDFVVTRELKGNYIKILNVDFTKWSNRKWKIFIWKNNYIFIEKCITFKEKIWDRIVEYFFGYYQNPVKRLFQISNIKKIKKLAK